MMPSHHQDFRQECQGRQWGHPAAASIYSDHFHAVFRSITSDNGDEFAALPRLLPDTPVYYAIPIHPTDRVSARSRIPSSAASFPQATLRKASPPTLSTESGTGLTVSPAEPSPTHHRRFAFSFRLRQPRHGQGIAPRHSHTASLHLFGISMHDQSAAKAAQYKKSRRACEPSDTSRCFLTR